MTHLLSKTRLSLFSLILITLLILMSSVGCVSHKAKTQELLSEDYLSLSDDNLILYFYKLEDQIEIVERNRNRSSISFGLGLGSSRYHRGSGGIGVSTGSSQRDVATNLRDRRNKVKLELKHRGLTP